MSKWAYDHPFDGEKHWPLQEVALNEIHCHQNTIFRGHDVERIRAWVDSKLPGDYGNRLNRVLEQFPRTDLGALKMMTLVFYVGPDYRSRTDCDLLANELRQATEEQTTWRVREIFHRGSLIEINNEVWAKEVCTRYAGRLVNYHEQRTDRRLADLPGVTDGGWCLGMACEWLRCKANKLDFWSRHSVTPEDRSELLTRYRRVTAPNIDFWVGETGDAAGARYRYTMAVQQLVGIMRRKGQAFDLTGRAADARGLEAAPALQQGDDDRQRRLVLESRHHSLRHAGFTVHEGEIFNEVLPGLANRVAGGREPYYLVSLYGPHNYGHAMAVYRSSRTDELYFMDPNMGEFAFKTREDFTRWLRLLDGRLGYRRLMNGYALFDARFDAPQLGRETPAAARAVLEQRGRALRDGDD